MIKCPLLPHKSLKRINVVVLKTADNILESLHLHIFKALLYKNVTANSTLTVFDLVISWNMSRVVLLLKTIRSDRTVGYDSLSSLRRGAIERGVTNWG